MFGSVIGVTPSKRRLLLRKEVVPNSYAAQENSSENDTFQAGMGWEHVGSPPSTAKLVGWKMSDHKKSLFRSIELISLKLH